MKNIFALVIIAVSFALGAQVDRSKAPESGAAPTINLPKPVTFTLDNGLTVIVAENHKVPRVAVQLFADYGTLYEGDVAGVTSMFGSMMETGTTTKSKKELDEEIDFIGASVSFSSKGFYASSLTKHNTSMMDIVSDMFFNPAFNADELEKIRTRTLSGLETSKSDPNSMAASLKAATLYGQEHPYGESATTETVENVAIEDVKELYNTYFAPNISYLVVVGDIKPEDAKVMAEKYFGSWEKKDVPTYTYDVKPQPEANQVVFVKKPGAEQSVINVAFTVDMKPGAPDALAASVMNSILGGGVFSGRLMQNLRETHAWTYGCRSNISTDELIGSFSTSGSFRNEVTDSAVYEILKEINTMTMMAPTMEELSLVKNSMSGGFARALESPQTIARFALNTIRYDLPEDYYASYLKRLEALTLNDIQKVAEKYLRPNNAYIVICGNEEIIPNLDKFDKLNNQVSVMDMYGNPVEELLPAPEGMSAYDVFEKHYMAVTGTENIAEAKDKFESMKSYVEVKTALIQGMESTWTTKYMKGPKSLFTINVAGMTVMKNAFNGKSGYSSAQGQRKEYSDEEVEDAKSSGGFWTNIDAREKGDTMELVGIDKLRGEKVYVVKAKTKDSDLTYYFSVESGLLLKTEGVITAEGQTVERASESFDYTDMSGFLMPKRTLTKIGGQVFDLELVSFEVNVKVDKKEFN